jgi:type IV pilus assembly protein PilQ
MKSSQIVKIISLFIFWLFLTSCATSNTSIQSPPSDIPSRISKISLIQNLSFIEEENCTRIQIEGSETLDPPFYKLLSDPLRIVIDISNIDLNQIKEPLKIDNGTVTEVLATQFDDKGRIEIGLAQMANYNIFNEDKNLIIDIEKAKDIVGTKDDIQEEEAGKEKETELTPPEVKKEEPPPTQPVEIPSLAEILKRPKEVLNVSFDQGKEFLTFNIITDGKIVNYDAFKLDTPTRLVLDIWGVDTRYPKNSIKIKKSFINQVRLGRHPDKLRFVFECPNPRLPSYQINQMEGKIVVSFGNVPQPSKPQTVSKEKAIEKTPYPQAMVNAPIGFKQMDSKSRIIVSLTEEPQFEVSMASKKMIALNIKNAFLPKHFQSGLDTSAFDSAVKYIDPKNIKVGKKNEVQILINLKEEVPFETMKEGKTLLIDIEKPKMPESKIEAIPESKKDEVPVEIKKEEIKKEQEKSLPEMKKMESVLPKAEEKPIPQPEMAKKVAEKKVEEVKKVTEESFFEKTYKGRKVSLDFKDADIKNILRLIAEVSNFNIITGDDVTGKITMRLVDVPWDQALDVILQAKSLGMTKVGNVIRIAPVDSLKKQVQTELEAKRAKEKLEDLVTELIPVNYATAKEILSQVKGILSDRGDIKVDDRTNILIVKDIARNIIAARSLVRSLDAKTPQVLIEARIVEATLTFQKNLGIQWGFMAHKGPDNNKELSVGGGTAGTSTLRSPIGTSTVNTRKLVDLAAGTAGSSIIELLFTSGLGLKNLDISISAFESQGDVKIVSSPKIATLDNKEASVEQGLRIPYTRLTTEGTATEEFIEANLKLTVTPHVTNDGHIKMSIKVKKDEPDYSHPSTFGTPSIDKKESVTEVLVKDNGVVVIAGIYTIKKDGGTIGVPLFSKIPILGWLFKKESKSDERKDLLIFISPKIIKDQV